MPDEPHWLVVKLMQREGVELGGWMLNDPSVDAKHAVYMLRDKAQVVCNEKQGNFALEFGQKFGQKLAPFRVNVRRRFV